MPDLDKVLKGFMCCHQMVHDRGDSACGTCPYRDVQTKEQIDLGGIECIAVLHDEAQEILIALDDLYGDLPQLYAAVCSAYKHSSGLVGLTRVVTGHVMTVLYRMMKIRGELP